MGLELTIFGVLGATGQTPYQRRQSRFSEVSYSLLWVFLIPQYQIDTDILHWHTCKCQKKYRFLLIPLTLMCIHTRSKFVERYVSVSIPSLIISGEYRSLHYLEQMNFYNLSAEISFSIKCIPLVSR